MVRWVVAGSIKFRLIVLALAASVLVLGPLQLSRAPVDVLPEFMPPYVEIQTEALGLSSAEVEQLITVPLEADLLNGVQDVDVIRSKSVAGLSSIIMVFKDGIDPYLARARVQERLTQAHALPQVSKPPTMLQPLSSSSRILMVSLSSTELSPIERSVLARWTVRPRLMGVPGVANVAIWGQREQQLQVQVDPEKLKAKGVTLQQVVNTTGNAQIVSPLSFLEASTPGTGGFIETAQQRLQVRHVFDSLASPAELGKVPLDDTNGALTLADVATIVEDHQPLIGDAIIDGKGEGLLLVVEKFPGANTVEVTKAVESTLETLRPGLSGMQIDTTLFRPAGYISGAMSNLAVVGIVAACLLLLALLGWFLEWRTGLVALVAVPVALVAAALVLQARDTTFNAMAFAGLAVAAILVIDDAVSAGDTVGRRRRQARGAEAGEAEPTVVEALSRSRGRLGYALVIGLVLIVPLVAMEGRPGAFFAPIALSYALALLASFVVGITVVPALASLLGTRMSGRGPARLASRLAPAYDTAVARVLKMPRAALATVTVVGIISVVGLVLATPSVVPTLKDRDVLVSLSAAPGTSLPVMSAAVSQVSQQLRALDGVEAVGAHVGRAVTGDQVVDVSSSGLWVRIGASADYDQTLAAISGVAARVTGFSSDVVTYSSQRVRDVGALNQGTTVKGSGLDVLTGSEHPVVVRIYGEDMTVMRQKAEEIRTKMAAVETIANPVVQVPQMQDEITIEVDLARAQQYGIKPGDVRRAEAILLQGIQVGSIFEGQKVFDVVVQGVPQTRTSVDAVRNLLIDSPSGGTVRLADLATVRLTKVPTTIERDAVARHLDVTADVRSGSVEAAAEAVQEAIAGVAFPLEHHAEVLTSSAGEELNASRIIAYGVGALIAVFFLLQAAFGSWRLGALAFLSLPAALSGGALVTFFTGLSLGAALGLLALFGLAVRNALHFVRECQQVERETGRPPDAVLARQVATSRLAPVFGSALALTALALPVLFMGSRAGLEVLQPMALVLIAGLATSALLSLFLLPALYVHQTRRRTTPEETSAADPTRDTVGAR